MTKEQEKQWYRENAKIVYDFLASKKPFPADYTFEYFAEDFHDSMRGYPMEINSFIRLGDYMNNDFTNEYGERAIKQMRKLRLIPQPA